jgi:hypothetical protein
VSIVTIPLGADSLNGQLLASFYNMLTRVYVWAAVAFHQEAAVYQPLPPSYVIQEIVHGVIDRYDIGYVQEKQQVGNDESSTRKKRKEVKYIRQYAKECARSDWFDPMPRFNDHQFDQTF